MTYFGFLLRFLVFPITILFAIYLWDRYKRRRSTSPDNYRTAWFAIGLHIVLALVYTTPWDNYLVATGVWYYNPELVTGIVLGYVPIEEYTFFVLETLFVGLWWIFLSHRISSHRQISASATFRLWSSVILAIIWVISILVFLSGWQAGTYLSITLLWALPPLIAQCAFGADILWHYRKLVLATIVPMGSYLSFTDSLAITATTWTISPAKSTSLFIGSLPLEEGIFFFITVVMVTCGVTLMKSQESKDRLTSISRSLASLLRGGHKNPTKVIE